MAKGPYDTRLSSFFIGKFRLILKNLVIPASLPGFSLPVHSSSAIRFSGHQGHFDPNKAGGVTAGPAPLMNHREIFQKITSRA
jgi:hypothetical protein